MAIIIFLTFITLFLSLSPSTADNNSDLVNGVCNQTTDPKFCHDTFRSDPNYQGSAAASPRNIAYIIFSKTYMFGSDTQTNIQSNITKSGGRKLDVLSSLKTCETCYANAVDALCQVLLNLDSEMYCFIDKLSAVAKGNATVCGKGLKGSRKPAALRRENGYFIKLAGICYAVSELFPYEC